MTFNSNLCFSETNLGFGEFDADIFKVKWQTGGKDYFKEKDKLGLNKVRLSLKRHFSIIFQFIQQGFYIDVKIVKSQKRKAL